MNRPVIAAVDGSAPARAAALWAAREAVRRKAPLRLVTATGWPGGYGRAGLYPLLVEATQPHLAQAESAVAEAFPELPVETSLLMDSCADSLVTAGEDAELVVLGSRGSGGFRGMLLGSVALGVAARCENPVVLVREGRESADGDVVVGVEAHQLSTAVLEFAFRAAELRGARLRAVHTWSVPALWGAGPVQPGEAERAEIEAYEQHLLRDEVQALQVKFPSVEVVRTTRCGGTAEILLEEAEDAGLLVVGRHLHRAPRLTHLGPVTHAAIHYATAPVAVVPHG